MRKHGLVILVLLLFIALISAPVLAKPGLGSGNGKAANSKDISITKSLDKSSGKSLQNIKSQQKKQIKTKLQERQKQTTKKEFKDTSSHWANKKIAKIQSLGLISGYQDGSFKPDAQVSNAEAMTMVVNLADTMNTEDSTQTETTVENQEPAVTEEVNDSDVPEWAKESATQAVSLKIININRFHSQVQASRAQVAVMLAKALKLEPVTSNESGFTDGKFISAEDIGYILALKEAGIIKGSPDGKFNPNSSITRAEMATMLANVVEDVEEDESNTDPATTDDTTTNPEQTTPPASDTGDTTTPAPTGDNTAAEPVNNDSTINSSNP